MTVKTASTGVKCESAPGLAVTDIAGFQSVQMSETGECTESARTKDAVELAFGKAEGREGILHYQYVETDISEGNIRVTPRGERNMITGGKWENAGGVI